MIGWIKSLFGSKQMIMVSIPVEGEFPSPDDLSARNAVSDSLEDSGFGEFIGAGGGFGQMDFEFEVANAEEAKQQVANAMKRFLPGREYSVTVE